MLKLILWVGAIVFGYLAWKAGDLHERTGDIAYLKQAIGWGIASLACVVVAVWTKSGGKSGSKKDSKASAGSIW
jgi:hypothetical protein